MRIDAVLKAPPAQRGYRSDRFHPQLCPPDLGSIRLVDIDGMDAPRL